MRFCFLGAVLMLVSCGDNAPSAAEQRRIDDAKIAAVKATMILPPVPVSPQPIVYADIERENLFGLGCAFRAVAAPDDDIAITQEDVATIKIGDKFLRLAADAGSADGPMATKTRYDGKVQSLEIAFSEGDGRQSGSETVDYDAHLVIRNQREQPVYEADGIAQCGS